MSYDEHLISMAGGDGDVLDQIQRRADAATEGPWEAADSTKIDEDGAPIHCEVNVWSGAGDYISTVPEGFDGNAEFIAHARTDIPALLAMVREQRAVIERAKALHIREVIAVHEGYGEEAWCPNCRVHWPCEDYAALTATEGAE